MSERAGGCQCGRVRYRISVEPLFLAVCHCKECQRASGSAFGMSLMVPHAGFQVEGELKAFDRPADSGRTLRGYFCPECGTRIYHQRSDASHVNVRAGTLDDTADLKPSLHAWTGSKQAWTPIPEGAATHPKQP